MGGYVVGILGKDKPHKAWALGYGRRVNATVPPEFSVGGYAYDHLKEVIVNRAKSIRSQMSSSRANSQPLGVAHDTATATAGGKDMAPLAAPPTTEALFKAAAEEVARKFEVEIGKGRIADLLALGDRINVYLESSDKPMAVLRFWQPIFRSLVAGR